MHHLSALLRTYKAFRDKLYLYNFRNKFKDPTSHFTKVKPKLKLIALSKKDRTVHSKAAKVDVVDLKQQIQVMDDIWKHVQSLNASIAQLEKEQELLNNVPQSE